MILVLETAGRKSVGPLWFEKRTGGRPEWACLKHRQRRHAHRAKLEQVKVHETVLAGS